MDWINWDMALSLIRAMQPLRDSEIPLWAVFTHSCDDTNYFKNIAGLNGYFWIKRPKRYSNFIRVAQTGGLAEYADWDSPQECLAYYIEHIRKNFPDSLKCIKCSHCFLRGVRTWKFNDENAAHSYFRELARKHRYLQGEDRIKNAFVKILDYSEI